MQYEFQSWEKSAIDKVIRERRDIRSFRSEPIQESLIWKILQAGHHAPSVGYSQPWNFLIIQDKAKHREVYEHFVLENQKASQLFPDSKGETYRSLKLQGLLDAPVHVVVTCDSYKNGQHVLGRTSVKEVDEYSVCLAVQNIWLTARAEGIGVGWMSIYDPNVLPKILGMPDEIKIIAYLCLGEPVWFPEIPMLETSGWKKREDLADLVFWENWNQMKKNDLSDINHQTQAKQDLNLPNHHQTFEIDLVKKRLDEFTKPKSSLGLLEDFVIKLASIQKKPRPYLHNKTVLILAADHGIAESKISAYSQDSTYKMVYQYLAGSGAVNSFARGIGAKFFIADLGVKHHFQDGTALLGRKVRLGTRSFLKEPALSHKEVKEAIQIGKNLWNEIPETDVLSLGEVGIGNTTCSVVIASLLFDIEYSDLLKNNWIGRGTGVSGDLFENKKNLIQISISKYKKEKGYYQKNILELLENVGGLEIIGMVGVILGSEGKKTALILDGLISTLAGVIAYFINPEIEKFIFVGHLSYERLHSEILRRMDWKSILNLELRLGEATGSTLAIGILEQACRFNSEMKTWDEVNWFDR